MERALSADGIVQHDRFNALAFTCRLIRLAINDEGFGRRHLRFGSGDTGYQG